MTGKVGLPKGGVSSAGQSKGLIILRSRVQAPHAPQVRRVDVEWLAAACSHLLRRLGLAGAWRVRPTFIPDQASSGIGSPGLRGRVGSTQATTISQVLGKLPDVLGTAQVEQAEEMMIQFAGQFDSAGLSQLFRHLVEVVDQVGVEVLGSQAAGTGFEAGKRPPGI